MSLYIVFVGSVAVCDLPYVFEKRKLFFHTLPLLLTIKLPYVFQKRKLWSFNKNTIQIAIIYNICNQKFLILP